ncbi:DNA gyrase inhibitor YacG [Geothermobacter hydrogeniphilus]|uniref:DNA gyrase inhibitor YacG n=1 Tax=Geothermobacter hydrogeniphilus TaxID=1969733 RepID=A0A1X0YEQ8_9BACT|nr:DNA gyrase inhibitor YacG [Geothermobacter hydrogeniphilus]ORJ63616.1 DNA gyrase inhibitor YacG [Geothermobacter hydrogeniphilus]PNU19060.1 DNA gyrase inhibitor YacG [Geothermobacter hydrogeniphilus]
MTDKTRRLTIKCPRCGVLTDYYGNEHRPFCSERCRLIDLGCWAEEEYRIAGRPVPQESDSPT